jgi:excisionase family DNA binding protein
MQTKPQDQYVTVEEMIRQLSLSKNKAYDLLSRGEIEAVKIGKAVRVSRSSLEDYLARNAYSERTE